MDEGYYFEEYHVILSCLAPALWPNSDKFEFYIANIKLVCLVRSMLGCLAPWSGGFIYSAHNDFEVDRFESIGCRYIMFNVILLLTYIISLLHRWRWIGIIVILERNLLAMANVRYRWLVIRIEWTAWKLRGWDKLYILWTRENFIII